jgi:hypothetical protein
VLAAVTGCGGQAQPEGQAREEAAQTQQGIIFPDFCASATADQTVNMFNGVYSAQVISDSGGYFYTKTDGCYRWVVDFKLDSTSNDLTLSGDSYDLPSSASAGGYLPANPEDCSRYTLYVAYYRKLSTETAFTSLGSATFKGSWSNNQCNMTLSSGSVRNVEAHHISSGTDTFRVVVGAKLRATWQQVAAYSDHAPPK